MRKRPPPSAPAVPPTTKEKEARYLRIAESELVHASKAGRLDAQTVHATRAGAAATLALHFHLLSNEEAEAPKPSAEWGGP
jgi:hypothetical protein